MRGDLFRGIRQFKSPAPAGTRHLKKKSFLLPVFYYDNSSLTAIFTASTKKLRRYLPDPLMHPLEAIPGRCLLTFTAFEYRKTDIDPYNEFSIAVLINYGKRAIPGFSVIRQLLTKSYSAWVWHLPVTTELARWGGVELYGYPKFLAGIEFTRSGGEVRCALSEKKKHILTLRGRILETGGGGTVRYRTFPVKDGITLSANVFTHHLEYAESRRPSDVSLEIGKEHPICSELRGIDLGTKALTYQYSAVNEAVLFGPKNLMDD